MIRIVSFCAVLLLATLARAAGPSPFEFVTQQVCVDASDHAIAGDPAHCAPKRRVKIGEVIPYRRVDAGNWQAFVAYPVRSPGGEKRAMVAKIFGGNDRSGSYGDLGERSGYDLLEIDDYVSGIRTSDQGAGDQIFWRTADCDRTNGWIFFPPGLKPGEHGEIQSTLKITKGPSIACPREQLRNIAPDFTTWERPAEPFLYTSGKRLDSIVSMHFAYGDPADTTHDNDSMEKFYFTEPYGYSRWEAWETPQGCEQRATRGGQDPVAACQPYPQERCSGPNQATYFGKLYLRLDCRDATFIDVDPDRAFDPLVNSAAPFDVLSRNLLSNGTFFEDAKGWTAVPDAMPRRAPRSNNAALDLAAGGRLSQDFPVPPEVAGLAEGGTLRWGVTLAGAGGATEARLTLTLLAEGGAPFTLERQVRVAGAEPQASRFDAVLTGLPGRLVSGRLTVALAPGAGARVDDAFAAMLAGGPPAP